MSEPRFCYRHPDRETGLSCSECGRPICADCMTVAPVGIRCPEHSGKARGVGRVRQNATKIGAGTPALVTRVLIGINVAVYALELATGAGINADSGWIYQKLALAGSGVEAGGTLITQPAIISALPDSLLVGVAHGDWWRLITTAFLHYGPIHLGMNMLVLWWFGAPLEHALGRARFIGLYLASGLAGSAGALVWTPNGTTVGASGAIFGLFGAAFVLERSGSMIFGGQALTIIVINLVFTLAVGGPVSVGGHIGGLVGGALLMLALVHFRRSLPLSALSAVGVAAASVVIAYWKARGYT